MAALNRWTSRIVAILELAIEVDPFLTRPITDIRTVDDLWALPTRRR